MQSVLDQLLSWSDQNNMQINSLKTKKMIFTVRLHVMQRTVLLS